MTHWQDVLPERRERRPQRPPLSLPWSRLQTPPEFPTLWAYRALTPDGIYLWVYRQGKISWRWAAVIDAPQPPLQTGLLGTKVDAQLAAEHWYQMHTRPQPTLFGGDHDRRTGTAAGTDDLPF